MKVIRHGEYPPLDESQALNRLRFEGLNSRILVARQGCAIPRHGHQRAEEIFLLSGRVRFNDDVLEAGDILRTEAGEEHEAEALEDSRFLVVNAADGL